MISFKFVYHQECFEFSSWFISLQVPVLTSRNVFFILDRFWNTSAKPSSLKNLPALVFKPVAKNHNLKVPTAFLHWLLLYCDKDWSCRPSFTVVTIRECLFRVIFELIRAQQSLAIHTIYVDLQRFLCSNCAFEPFGSWTAAFFYIIWSAFQTRLNL